MIGHVSLVGAGPGDPALLTRRAAARLRSADLVLYDALVDLRVLKLARRAQKFFVGKRAGRHAMTQAGIHALLVRVARRGRKVVRLKGGDPFVFGRGGEEAIALRAAGIPFDIVPGITSAIAAPELAGIPVTHRGVSSAVLIVSGHDVAAFTSTVARLEPGGVTLVILMGTAQAMTLATRLMDSGWPRSTPVAIVLDASTSRQQSWRGRLGDLARDEVAIESSGPGTIVVGDVAALDLRSVSASGALGESHEAEETSHVRGR